jgi:hypothetical protein
MCSASGGKTFDPPIPACITHDCIKIATSVPDLSERIAQCSYLPKEHAPRPSSCDLPFFKFKGDGSPSAKETCKCGRFQIVHYPRWRADIEIERRWYKHERYKQKISREFHAPPDLAQRKAEVEADFFRSQTYHKDTEVFRADVVRLTEIRSPTKCKQFTPHGAYEFDEYYCGCHGWN